MKKRQARKIVKRLVSDGPLLAWKPTSQKRALVVSWRSARRALHRFAEAVRRVREKCNARH
jgi:hypothetical protein